MFWRRSKKLNSIRIFRIQNLIGHLHFCGMNDFLFLLVKWRFSRYYWMKKVSQINLLIIDLRKKQTRSVKTVWKAWINFGRGMKRKLGEYTWIHSFEFWSQKWNWHILISLSTCQWIEYEKKENVTMKTRGFLMFVSRSAAKFFLSFLGKWIQNHQKLEHNELFW